MALNSRGGGELQPFAVGCLGDEDAEEHVVLRPAQFVEGRRHFQRVGEAPGEHVLDPGPGVERQEGPGEAGLHVLAKPALLAFVQGREHTVEQGLGGAERGEVHRHERRPIGRRRHALESLEDAQLGVDEVLVARRIGQGALVAEPADRGVDQARVAGRHRIVAEAERLHHARSEAFDHHIGAAGEIQDRLAVVRGVDVEDDALLAAGPEGEGGHLAQRGAARRLHHHHLGAEVGQELAHMRAGLRPAEVHDPQSRERLHPWSPPQA
jgi:hypothetical protein